MFPWLCCSWAIVRQNITVGKMWKRRLAHLMVAGSRERERETGEEGTGDKIFKVTPLSTTFSN
jgi:hypothetical protein